ncbi:unnamed protein product [Aureobasidium pullulans]|nr:unnamed protein product [Aureobasidium pullulans]
MALEVGTHAAITIMVPSKTTMTITTRMAKAMMGSVGLKYRNSVFGREAHDEGTEIVEIVIPGRKLAIKMARAQEQANQVTAPNQSLDHSINATLYSPQLSHNYIELPLISTRTNTHLYPHIIAITMNDHSYHGGHRSITQGDSASHGFDTSFTNPGANNMRTQVPNLAVAKVSYQFHDFINPQSGDPGAPIWVKGSIPSLDSLDLTINSGATVQRSVDAGREFATYTPLVNSVNHVCLLHDLVPIREQDLIQLQRQQWFGAFMKQTEVLTGDRMVLLLEALEFVGRLPKIFLGVVVHQHGSQPWAMHYPCQVPQSEKTAWVLVEISPTGARYYGFGDAVAGKQVESDREVEGYDEDVSDEDAEATKAPKANSRKTASRILALQAPLPAGTSVDDIMEKYPDRVHYINILKVGLKYSNKTISESLKTHGLKLSSGVVKRINVAIDWIESEFAIDKDAFRTTYDRERRAADIPARGKDEVEDDVLEANRSKIANAMTWVKTGGPRPLPTTVTGATAASGHGTVPFKGNASIASGAGLYATPLLVHLLVPWIVVMLMAMAPADDLQDYQIERQRL